MVSALPYNPYREQILDQFQRLEKLVTAFSGAFKSLDGDVVKFELDTEAEEMSRIEQDPNFQKGEWWAERIAILEDQLRSAECEMAASAVAALYHNWERSVKWLIAKKADPWKIKAVMKANFLELRAMLGPDAVSNDCTDQIDYARLITNVFKHGEGSAADELRRKDADIFQRPWGQDDDIPRPTDDGLTLIWVHPEQAKRTAQAIKQFWETLPDAYFPPIPRPSMKAFTAMDKP